MPGLHLPHIKRFRSLHGCHHQLSASTLKCACVHKSCVMLLNSLIPLSPTICAGAVLAHWPSRQRSLPCSAHLASKLWGTSHPARGAGTGGTQGGAHGPPALTAGLTLSLPPGSARYVCTKCSEVLSRVFLSYTQGVLLLPMIWASVGCPSLY